MQNAPLVSIILPSFNQARFIAETLESVLNQTYRPIEVIVIDGGSTDGTVEILKEYADKIKWISEPDNGEYSAINKGLCRAKGKYVRYSPTDDLLSPYATSLFVDYMEAHPDVAMVYGQFAYIDEEGRITEFSIQAGPFHLKAYLRKKFSHGSMTMMVRRDVFEKVGLFDTDFSYTGDFEFIARLAYRGFKIIYLPYLLGGFRRYPQHQSARLRKIIRRQALLVVQKYGSRKDLYYAVYHYFVIDFRTILGKIKWDILGLLGKTRQTGKPDFFFHDLY